MDHSKIVGGSTASRVIACPGSVPLVQQMPPKSASKYANEGSLLHNVMADVLPSDRAPEDYLGRTFEGAVLTQDLIDEKIRPAFALLAEVDPECEMELEVERRVGFGDLLPGVFGSVDVIGKLGRRTIILDWKFGDGVPVEAEENKQLLFYAAAARLTPETKWAFEGTDELELVIVQPPHIRRWVTTFERLNQFVDELAWAVKAAQSPDAKLAAGDHCRWCAAKPICPIMAGAADRALRTPLDKMDAEKIGRLLTQAELVEEWIKDLRVLAQQMLENDKPVPGWKLVQKRAVRKWKSEGAAALALQEFGIEPYVKEILSPAAAEKILKKTKLTLPGDLVEAVSSGSTLAPESDPRPALLNIGRQLSALSNLK